MSERLERPHFIIVGAMKSGTTTLYRDLMTNPGVFFPADKEPGTLCHDEVLTEAGKRGYARLFAGAGEGRVCGEASTTYTKLPDLPGCAERAGKILRRDLKVIYLVREPVSRLVSHHHHEFSSGEMTEGDIDVAVGLYPRLVAYSRYAMQIEPWVGVFGRENVRVVRFEDFVSDRRGVVGELSGFIGVEPRPELVDEGAVFNQSESKPLAKGAWGAFATSGVYRRVLRPMIPLGVRDRIRAAVLPKAPPRPEPPSEGTVERLLGVFEEDGRRLAGLMGKPWPIWDVEKVRKKYARASKAG